MATAYFFARCGYLIIYFLWALDFRDYILCNWRLFG